MLLREWVPAPRNETRADVIEFGSWSQLQGRSTMVGALFVEGVVFVLPVYP